MPHKNIGPRVATRWVFYKLPITYQIVPSIETEAKCYLCELAFAYRDAVISDNPRVMRLGLQVLLDGLRPFLSVEGV